MGDSGEFPTNSSSDVLLNEICEPGLFLPWMPYYESTWSIPVRATLYFLGLIYSFMGLAIVADMFMGSIEKITSKTKKISQLNNCVPEIIEVRVWNGTVANLSLMALGSSAPEILLSCIEIVGNRFEVGALGPAAIVGSAAFNLLVICATCIMAIPNGETRKIKMFGVFSVTTGFSLFAYIWLLVILLYSSPDVVEVWEALLTFLFFPVLILIAWLADRMCTRHQQVRTAIRDEKIENGNTNSGPGDLMSSQIGIKNYGAICNPGATDLRPEGFEFDCDTDLEKSSRTSRTLAGNMPDCKISMDERKFLIPDKHQVDKDAFIEVYKELRKFSQLSDHDAATLVAKKLIDSQPHSSLWYRIGAVRSLSGGRRVQPKLPGKLKKVYKTLNTSSDDEPTVSVQSQKAIVEFSAACYAVPENIGKFAVTVIRRGRMDNTVRVRVESFDGTAKAGIGYIPVNEQLIFGPYATEREISVNIIDDNQWEPDEQFFLRLSIVDEGPYDKHDVTLGKMSTTDIVILDDDEAGLVSFRRTCILVKESRNLAYIKVERARGADGDISVQWRTIDGSAKSPKDYQGGEGTLIFKHGETLQTLEIPIMDDMKLEREKFFEIELMNPDGGAQLGKITKMAVVISNDDNFGSALEKMMLVTSDNMKSMQAHQDSWRAQIQSALTVNGGDIENATSFDYVMHSLTFAWKVLFSLLPPPSYCGGWLCFFCSLSAMGLLTAIVGDLATIFGCLIGLRDSVTAITLVTLGTSLPDLFASRTAAISDDRADNAVGNFTGSNSVNVFLGLGLPWLIAAIYHAYNGTVFQVPSGSLGFSVAVYSAVAFLGLVIILMRRFLSLFGNAELGGPSIPKFMSGVILIALWLLYIVILTLKAYDLI